MQNICRIASFVIIAGLSGNSYSADRIGVVGAANDAVYATASEGEKRTLKLGNDIFFKDKVTTDAKGNAQLMFVDKSALTVGPNSLVTIDEFVYNPATNSGNMVMQGTKGTFRFIGGALSKKDAVKIKTPVGTIGIRGGILDVNINPETNAVDITKVYGIEATFQDLNGVVTAISDNSQNISIAGIGAQPVITNITPEQAMAHTAAIAGPEGASAGATDIPTEADVGAGLNTDSDKGPEANAPIDTNKPAEGEGKPVEGDNQDKTDAPKDGAVNEDGSSTEGDKVADADKKEEGAASENVDESTNQDADKESGALTEDDASNLNKEDKVEDDSADSEDADKKKSRKNKDDNSADNEEGDISGNGDNADNGDNSDKKDGDKTDKKEANSKTDNKDGKGQGTGKLTGDNKNTNSVGNKTSGDRTAANNPAGTANNNDGGHATNDGGYVDGEGRYHTPAEVAANKADNTATATGNGNTANNMNKTVNGPATGTAAGGVYNGPATGAAAAGGGYNGPATGSAAAGGAYYNGNGTAAATPATGAYYGGAGTAATAGTNYYGAAAPAAAYGTYNSPATTATGGYYGGAAAPATAYSNTYTAPAAASGYGGYNTYAAPATNYYGGTTAAYGGYNTYNTYTAPAVGGYGGYVDPYAAAANTYYGGSATTTPYYQPINTYYYDPYNNTATAAATAAAAANTYNTYNSTVNFGNVQAAQTALVTKNLGGASDNANLAGTNTRHYSMGNVSLNPPPTAGVGSTNVKTLTISDANYYENNVRANCTSCNYVDWDFWARVVTDGYTTAPVAESQVRGQIVPYVYGQLTNLGNITGPVSATYTGGTLLNASNLTSPHVGTFTATLSLNTGSASLTGFNFNVPDGTNLSMSGGPVNLNGGPTFNGVPLTGNYGYGGTVNGSLFGPTAQNIGGNMTFGNGAGINGAGVYAGSCTNGGGC